MDDPWGSPWTSAAPAESSTSSPTKSDLEPPPRAFLSTTSSPRLPAVSVESPWADNNDGFGDWTAADTTAAPAQLASGWGGGWGGADTPGAHGHQHLTPTPKDEGFGFAQASPIAWPGSIASPSSKNGHSSAFRQPSPDPWASEFDDFPQARDGLSTPQLVLNRPSTPTSVKELGAGASEEELGSVWDNKDVGGVVDTVTEGVTAAHHNEEDARDGITVSDNAHDSREPGHRDRSRPSTSSKPRSSHSRSSSTSRNGSDSDEDRQDSPITSIDEDAKSRIALPPRKVSGKIQVLVEKYDGLAKAAVDEPLPVRQDSGTTPPKTSTFETETPSEGVTDFDDFEDAVETPSTPAVQDSEPSSPRRSLERTPTPQMRSPETPTRQTPPSVAVPTSPYIKSPVIKRAAVQFDVDLEHIDGLFDDLQLAPPASHEDMDASLPEHVITDSFTEISERKAWYRISRQGSSRMHNSGDNDSYRRVAWPTTTVHDETLKIVRRWMEQDSITGRTTLGGGTNRTNMFNWDSDAEPVAFEQIFAKRRRQPRPISLQQPVRRSPIIPPTPAPASSTSGAGTAPTKRSMSLVGPTVAAFGWSTSPVDKQPGEIPRPIKPNKPALEQEQTLDPPLNRAAPRETPAPLNPSVPQEDDEDDWGEMVSSPAVDAKPMALPAFGGPGSTQPKAPGENVTSLPPSSDPVLASGAGRQSADTAYGSIEDLWELPQPEKLSEEPPHERSTTAEPLSYFGQPGKPIVATATDISSSNFTPTTPLAITSPLPIPIETPKGQPTTLRPSTDDDTEVESTVRRILENLPDLSYMLR
jgi:hypothetical protein